MNFCARTRPVVGGGLVNGAFAIYSWCCGPIFRYNVPPLPRKFYLYFRESFWRIVRDFSWNGEVSLAQCHL